MRWMIAFGWSVFALLTAVIGLQFLLACDFHFLGFERKTCLPRESNDGLRMALERQEALLREVHAAELRIAAKPVCLPVAEVKPPDAIQKRAYDRGAKQGKLEVFLDWNTLDDMDLSIGCPGGVIGGLKGKPGPGVCGDGKLDLDANRDLRINVASTPVEHIVWQDDIPAGDYSFEVYMFKAKDGTRELNVPFRLRIRLDDEERVCSSTIPHYPMSQKRTSSSGRILAGKNLSLRWTYGQPLPECNWTSVDQTYCDGCGKN
jgi:hypothetical protein